EPRRSDGRAGAVVMKNLHGSVGTAEAVVHSAARPHPCPRWRARSIAARTTVSRTPAQKTKNVSGVIAAGAATDPRGPGWLPSVPRDLSPPLIRSPTPTGTARTTPASATDTWR